jgi:arabinogalactan oligomer/maltooligosaccharide transport system substrate-binding protein
MSNRSKFAVLAASLALVAGSAAPVAAQTQLTLWTQEGEAENAFQWVQTLAEEFGAANDVEIAVVNKQTETLREDFLTSSLAGASPEILWTVADHIGPFNAAGLIAPLDDVIDTGQFVPAALAAVQADGQTWGVPMSFGNHLMLYWNKDIVPEGPANSDELVSIAQAHTDAAGGEYGLVFNQTESFWLVPFLGGFGGRVFADDGVTPTLDTEAMVGALTFMHDLKYADGVMPAEADYNVADGLFTQGDAAMIVNGDWALGVYADTFGDSLGIGPIPEIVGGTWPAPYTAGKFLMASADAMADPDTAAIVAAFMEFASNKANQLRQVELLRRLPGNAAAMEDPLVADDPFLGGSAAAVVKGIPQPTNLEMRCVFDSMTAGVRDLFSSESSDPAAIAATMQSSADVGVAPGGECAPE